MVPPQDLPFADGPAGESTPRHAMHSALTAIAVRYQAVGTLMAQYQLSTDQAGDRLQQLARETGRPVVLLARELVAGYSGSSDTPPGPWTGARTDGTQGTSATG